MHEVDKFTNFKELYLLLVNKEFFEELIQDNKLNKDDTRYLLNKIDKEYELDSLCQNISLIKYILNEFILNKETVCRLNTIIENDAYWCKGENVHTIFDYAEYKNKMTDNKKILKLID